jgi:hypothetical protein
VLSNLGIVKLYKGFSIALGSSVLYWSITLSNFETINNYFDKKKEKYGENFEYMSFIKKIFILFGATTLNAILASIFVYPLDTLKRHIQVNSSLGFKSEYNSLTQGINKFYAGGFLNMYR